MGQLLPPGSRIYQSNLVVVNLGCILKSSVEFPDIPVQAEHQTSYVSILGGRTQASAVF